MATIHVLCTYVRIYSRRDSFMLKCGAWVIVNFVLPIKDDKTFVSRSTYATLNTHRSELMWPFQERGMLMVISELTFCYSYLSTPNSSVKLACVCVRRVILLVNKRIFDWLIDWLIEFEVLVDYFAGFNFLFNFEISSLEIDLASVARSSLCPAFWHQAPWWYIHGHWLCQLQTQANYPRPIIPRPIITGIDEQSCLNRNWTDERSFY